MTFRVKQSPEAHRAFIGIDNLTEKHKKAIRHALFDVGIKSKYETIKAIKTGKKTGRLYKYGNKVHRSSAKGEAPANRTGNLARNVDYSVTGFTETMFGYTEEYGFYLEKGTEKDGSVAIAKRTNLERVIQENTQYLINRMVMHYKKGSD